MNRLTLVVVVVFSLISHREMLAQEYIGIKFFGLSIHPRGEEDNAFLMPNKLDKKGYLVMNLGAELLYEKFLLKDIISFRIVQALYADCAARSGGFSHIGVRAKIIKIGKHSLYGGIGPTLVYRRNWLEMDGYINQNRFKGSENDKWQYLFLWYGGEFEYKYAITDRLDFAASFIPAYPDLMSLAVGVNMKVNEKQHRYERKGSR